MGSLERRLTALEAQLVSSGAMGDSSEFEEQIAREALRRLSTPDLKRVVASLERVGEHYQGAPPDTPIGREVYEALLTDEELGALEYLGQLKAELREAG